MRPIPFLAALILAAPASAQELGERTRSPEQMLAQLGLAPGDRVIVNGIQKVSVGMPVTAQDIEMAPAGRQIAQASE